VMVNNSTNIYKTVMVNNSTNIYKTNHNI
jgi:hypothetical protein